MTTLSVFIWRDPEGTRIVNELGYISFIIAICLRIARLPNIVKEIEVKFYSTPQQFQNV